MMQKTLVVTLITLSGFSAIGQKASAEKQDEIISNQKKLEEQMSAVQMSQERLLKLYGNDIDPENQDDILGYAYGLTIGESFKQQGVSDISYGAFQKGMKDAITGQNPMMTATEAQQIINSYMSKMMQARSAEAKKEGEAFLTENAKRKEVNTTESGLQYEVIKEGTGAKPKADSKVTVHYEGKLLDGTVFDSSKQRGKPASFGLNQVIPGWTEGLQLMKTGATYKFFIPSELAYGDNGAGQIIGPGETLIFEVDLISIP